MARLDPYVKKLAGWVDDRVRAGPAVDVFDTGAQPTVIAGGSLAQAGRPGSSGVILRSDTFVELGSPAAGSCAFPLWTDDPSLIRDGRVTLIGPGVQASAGASLTFGQVLLIGGRALADSDHADLEQCQYVSDRIEGYMIRSTPGRMWSRVSKAAAAAGFDFDQLGWSFAVLTLRAATAAGGCRFYREPV